MEYAYIYFYHAKNQHEMYHDFMIRKSKQKDVLFYELRLLLRNYNSHPEHCESVLVFSSIMMHV